MSRAYVFIIVSSVSFLLLAVVFTSFLFMNKLRIPSEINNFQKCQEAGYLISGEYPRECIMRDKVFKEEEKTEIKDTKEKVVSCDSYTAEQCPIECVVCPPCPACSSITCQKEEFCKAMGIDKTWYEGIERQRAKIKDDLAKD